GSGLLAFFSSQPSGLGTIAPGATSATSTLTFHVDDYVINGGYGYLELGVEYALGGTQTERRLLPAAQVTLPVAGANL
ncbi:hypothetical protein NL533_36145, partial [Klebsiella pneumoniae]|nr:hypothetical protein [Klebsiella pneumoniae]